MGNVGNIIIGVGGLIVLTVIVFFVISSVAPVIDVSNLISNQTNFTEDNAISKSLVATPLSFSATRKNQTWLEFDDDDSKNIALTRYTRISLRH